MKVISNYFKIVGLDEVSSDILTFVISNPNIKKEQLRKLLKISKTELNSKIEKLVSKDILEITSENTIRITTRFALKTSKELEDKTSNFINKLSETRFLIVEKFVEEIQKLFIKEGYKILIEKRIETSRRYGISYNFTVEKFYKFGIIIFNSNFFQKITGDSFRFPRRFLRRIIYELEVETYCIGTFVFFDPGLLIKEVNKIISILTTKETYLIRGRAAERNGLFFIHEPKVSIEEFLEETLKDIEIRRDTVEQRFKDLKESLKKTKDIIVEDSMMLSQLNSLAVGQYLPELRKSKELVEFMKPVKIVTDRESRNLEIFERKFEEEKASIEREMDDFDKRIVLPNSAKLKEKLNRIERLKSKFEPIRHELRFLLQILLSPYIQGKAPKIINPFILTEPNNIETFTIDQEKIKNGTLDFLKYLNAKSSNLLFITGEAGNGKTHVIKHLYIPILKKEKIWTIYLDCPMKYDIVSSLFNEIIQDRNFPKEIHDLLPSLRKEKVSNDLEFTQVIKKLHDLIISIGYKGLVLLIDEFENALPYTYDIYYEEKKLNKTTTNEFPIALKQLKGILNSDFIKDTGFIIAFRSHILNEFRNYLGLKNFDNFIVTVEKLKLEDFKKLIDLRYKIWKSKNIKFNNDVLEKVLSITDFNIRHSIQYFRALYQHAFESESTIINLDTLSEIGQIPLFVY